MFGIWALYLFVIWVLFLLLFGFDCAVLFVVCLSIAGWLLVRCVCFAIYLHWDWLLAVFICLF